MLRRLIAVITLATGISMTAAITAAMPALAKGPSQALITGPGLDHAIVVSGPGEPGQLGGLATLAGQTGLFAVLFGAGGNMPAPARLGTPPPGASLGPRYTVIYTVPGVTPQPGEQFGRIRQDLYPRAAGGPVIYTPPRQPGFSQQVSGWFLGSPQLIRTLAQLGVPPRTMAQTAQRNSRPVPAHPAAAHSASARSLTWVIVAAAAIAAAALAGTALWLRRGKPASVRDS
jgi:hypothetical protein